MRLVETPSPQPATAGPRSRGARALSSGVVKPSAPARPRRPTGAGRCTCGLHGTNTRGSLPAALSLRAPRSSDSRPAARRRTHGPARQAGAGGAEGQRCMVAPAGGKHLLHLALTVDGDHQLRHDAIEARVGAVGKAAQRIGDDGRRRQCSRELALPGGMGNGRRQDPRTVDRCGSRRLVQPQEPAPFGPAAGTGYNGARLPAVASGAVFPAAAQWRHERTGRRRPAGWPAGWLGPTPAAGKRPAPPSPARPAA